MDYSSSQKLEIFVVDVKLLWVHLNLLGNKNTELVYPVRIYGQTQKSNQKHDVLRGKCSRLVIDNEGFLPKYSVFCWFDF